MTWTKLPRLRTVQSRMARASTRRSGLGIQSERPYDGVQGVELQAAHPLLGDVVAVEHAAVDLGACGVGRGAAAEGVEEPVAVGLEQVGEPVLQTQGAVAADDVALGTALLPRYGAGVYLEISELAVSGTTREHRGAVSRHARGAPFTVPPSAHYRGGASSREPGEGLTSKQDTSGRRHLHHGSERLRDRQ
jgi:hypothetical protein